LKLNIYHVTYYCKKNSKKRKANYLFRYLIKINYFEKKNLDYFNDIYSTSIFNFKSYETASKSLVWHNFLAGDGG